MPTVAEHIQFRTAPGSRLEVSSFVNSLREQRRREERDMLIETLRESGGNLTRAAEALGKTRGAIRYQARKLGLL